MNLYGFVWTFRLKYGFVNICMDFWTFVWFSMDSWVLDLVS